MEFLSLTSSKLKHIKQSSFILKCCNVFVPRVLVQGPDLQGYSIVTWHKHSINGQGCSTASVNSSGLGQKSFQVQVPLRASAATRQGDKKQGQHFTVCCLVSLLSLMSLSQGAVRIGVQGSITCVVSRCGFLIKIEII